MSKAYIAEPLCRAGGGQNLGEGLPNDGTRKHGDLPMKSVAIYWQICISNMQTWGYEIISTFTRPQIYQIYVDINRQPLGCMGISAIKNWFVSNVE